MKHIKDVNMKGKRVLLRVDFNVPTDENGNITDDTRIRKSVPTMQKLINDGAKTIIMSHLGRPKGEFDAKYSLKNVAKRISEILGKEVLFTQSLLGEEVTNMVNNMKEGDVMLLENIRFYKGETDGDMEFACSKIITKESSHHKRVYLKCYHIVWYVNDIYGFYK